MFASKDIFLKSSGGGYQISRSVRLRSSASAYLNRTLTTPTNNKIWTYSFWYKRGTIGDGGTAGINKSPLFDAPSSANTFDTIYVRNADNLIWYEAAGGATICYLETTQVFRDPSAWYHFVIVYDSAQATAADRQKIYVNGVQITAFSTAIYVAQNTNGRINSAVAHKIGSSDAAGTYLDGYITEANFIDGQALTPSSFGETNAITGVWQPKAYTGTYGTNGFELNFSDNSTAAALGTDFSGNSNTWTVNNISVTAGVTYDSMVDSPTVGATSSNYATLNPLDKTPASTTITASNGNLQVTSTNAGTVAECMAATIAIPANSGKWYWECQFTTENDAVGTPNTGIIDASLQITSDCYLGSASAPASIGFSCDGQIRTPTGNTSYTNPTSSQVVGFAYDSSNGKLWVAVAGTWQNSGDPAAGTGQVATASWYANGAKVANSSNRSLVTVFNFGQRPFSYTPPTGFVALNTQNLPTPTISNGATVMAATTYTGTGAALTVANTVGSASFQPDLVWVKGRSGATDHALYDAVRGVQNQLESNTTTAETAETTGLTAFGSTGFTIGALAQMNTNAATYVGWQWNAGGSTVTNTSGSISTQVRANTTASFSIATYTGNGTAGATIGHGLGVTPAMIIIKARTATAAENWFVYHKNLTAVTYYLRLNLTTAQVDGGSSGATSRVTAISSSVITLGPNAEVNESTKTYVAYCFAAVAGYSAFGSYTGNGSADGPFVFTGFRPRFVMVKRTDTTGAWCVYDTSRNTYNTAGLELNPNSSAAENSGNALDVLSNGFKWRDSFGAHNASGGTYIYAAFCENPFKLSLAR
jgi:hypothetical protein